MKIHDLINEDEVLDEFIAPALNAAGRAIASGASKIAPAISKGVSWLAQTGSRRDLINLMAKDPAMIQKTLKGVAPTVAEVEAIYGPRAAAIFARDPNFMTKVLKQFHADKLIGAGSKTAGNTTNIATKLQSGIKGLGQTASSVKGWTGKLISAGLTGAYYWILYEPLKLYMDNIEAAEEMLKNNKATPEEFEQYRQREMSALIGKWATLWATGKLAKLPFAIVAKVMGKFSPGLGSSISTLGTAGQVYFMNQVNSPENSQAIAEFMAGPIASKFIGGMGVEAENKIRKWIPFATEYDTKAGDKPEAKPGEAGATDKDADQTAADEKPTTTANPPAANKPKASPRDKWVYYSPGMVQDPVTKEIDYK
jgi:hypothetical protein